jgi:hypothetical protein
MESSVIAGGLAKQGQDGAVELVAVLGRVIGQLTPFEVSPEELDRIEFGSVGRESLDVQSRVGGLQSLDGGAAMTRPTVPDEDESAANVAEKLTNEVGDAVLVEVLIGK